MQKSSTYRLKTVFCGIMPVNGSKKSEGIDATMNDNIPEGFIAFDDHYYCGYSYGMSWEKAESFCSSLEPVDTKLKI